MLQTILMRIFRQLLSLRYTIRIKNLEQITAQGTKGILFLPNHPALIDPAIMNSVLFKDFAPRTLSDQKQLKIPFISPLIELYRPIALPDLKESRSNREAVLAQISSVVEELKKGENVLLYPSGQIYRCRYEDLKSNSSIERIIAGYPEVRIVLARTSGLWGSSFSWGYSDFPKLLKFLKLYLLSLFANLIFFIPRRKLEIEFKEPADFPRTADRNTINRYAEKFYNAVTPPNTFVPYYRFSKNKTVTVVEPQLKSSSVTLSGIPPQTSGRVLEKLSELTGIKLIKPTDNLSNDLGLDSLALADFVVWLEAEFGFSQESMEHLQTVGDLLLAACGQTSASPKNQFKTVDPRWFIDRKAAKLTPYAGETITEAFLNQALSAPDQVVIADQLAGAKTNRDILTAIFVLKSVIANIDDERVGLMLPASVTATITYMSLLFSGKTPVMVNWTVGSSILAFSLNLVKTRKVLTSKKLMEKLQLQGFDYSGSGIEWIYLEDIGASLTLRQKATGAFKARFLPGILRKSTVTQTAAILFTSGSEAKPKAVPLSHQNFIVNANDYLSTLTLDNNSRMIGMLPPFHSFGLACGVILPLISGTKIVYHANPTEGAILGELIGRYQINVLFGTPSFIHGILRTTAATNLSSVKYLVTGAEKCPQTVYDKIKESCPQTILSEAYGITECSPVVSINDLNNPAPGSIGKVIPGMEYRIVHPEKHLVVAAGESGLLLLRGGNVFSGYLNYSGNSPFLTYQNLEWYNTGDLVKEDENRVLWFCGRLKRFVKIGGEMISLSTVEEAMQTLFPPGEKGALIAVDAASPDENPELVLFSVVETDKESVNRHLRSAGLSGLYNIRRIIKVAEIPLLGSGKTDYRKLKELF